MPQSSDPFFGIDSELARLDHIRASLCSIREDMVVSPEKYRDVIEHASECWSLDSDVMWEWLCRPNMRLDIRSPIQATFDGDSDRVIQLITAITYGVYL